ncbi:MAG: VanZ family protein [Maribacter sp.]|nr:VanZ family protein [Maribacter sp.]
MLKKYVYAILFISWMVFVTFSSLYSFEGDDLSAFNIPYSDKIVHFVFYFVAATLGFLFFHEQNGTGALFRNGLMRIVFFLVFFGIIIEVVQERFTMNRSGDVFDALANSIGAISGVTAMYILFYSQRWLK